MSLASAGTTNGSGIVDHQVGRAELPAFGEGRRSVASAGSPSGAAVLGPAGEDRQLATAQAADVVEVAVAMDRPPWGHLATRRHVAEEPGPLRRVPVRQQGERPHLAGTMAARTVPPEDRRDVLMVGDRLILRDDRPRFRQGAARRDPPPLTLSPRERVPEGRVRGLAFDEGIRPAIPMQQAIGPSSPSANHPLARTHRRGGILNRRDDRLFQLAKPGRLGTRLARFRPLVDPPAKPDMPPGVEHGRLGDPSTPSSAVSSWDGSRRTGKGSPCSSAAAPPPRPGPRDRAGRRRRGLPSGRYRRPACASRRESAETGPSPPITKSTTAVASLQSVGW